MEKQQQYIHAVVAKCAETSTSAWDAAIATQDGHDWQDAAEECAEFYTLALEAIEAGDLETAEINLEAARCLESDGGDSGDASQALDVVRAALEAPVRGALDGVEDVETVLKEQGIEAVRATMRPGHVGWDEGAINAGAHRTAGVPEELSEAYYTAYAKAARARAEELAGE
jgi:hypothetical protein